jgi:hypothetical protein
LENPVKGAAVAVGVLVFGWALVASADARHAALEPTVVTEVHTVEVLVEVEAEPVFTPVLDDMIDWAEVDRQDDCLWRFMQHHELQLTFEMVWAVGEVADALGGACLLIGEDDE